MRPFAAFLALVTALVAVAAAEAPGQAPAPSERPAQAASGRLVVGMLRNDGILLPFAAFDGRSWSTPWPGAVPRVGSRDLPAGVSDIPKDWWGGEAPGAWRVLPRDGSPPQPLTLQSPAMVFVGAVRQLGLRTSQPPVPPPLPPNEVPYPKIGLAVAGEADIRPISMVSSKAAAWRDFGASLRTAIDDAEERAVRTLNATAFWRHPFDRAARSKIAPELEAWYVTQLTETGHSVSYIEAVKKFPLRPDDDGCGLETFVSGWVHQEEKTARPKATLKASVVYCDRDRVSYMLPFGQVRLRNRLYWIYQMSGRDHEWYVVTELTPGRERFVAEYQAGGIPR